MREIFRCGSVDCKRTKRALSPDMRISKMASYAEAEESEVIELEHCTLAVTERQCAVHHFAAEDSQDFSCTKSTTHSDGSLGG